MYGALHRHRPPHRWTNGDLAAKVGEDLGLPPDDEQRWILDTIFAEKAPERPASFEVGVISPRQNIKTSTLGIAALADLFVFGVEKHLWTAHHGATLEGTFGDFRTWIKSNPEYDEQVQFYEGHQDLSIVHRETGNAIQFQSRTGKAGRGLTGVKRITLDEALYLEPKHVGAVYPTMLTRPGCQVRIGSSAGLLVSEQLRRIRERGRSGKDKRLAYVEYGAVLKSCARPTCSHLPNAGIVGCALDDRDLWWQANCALWQGRITEESLEDQRNSLPPDEFMREFLSWWEDPDGGEDSALPYSTWLNRGMRVGDRGTNVVFGVDVDESRGAWISVGWRMEDDSAFLMMVGDEPIPAHAVTARCAELVKVWGGSVVPPRAFEQEMRDAGVPVLPMKSTDFTIACGAFADAVTAGTLHHGNQPSLNAAARAARWRLVGTKGEKEWLFKDCPEIGPLAAATRAFHNIGRDYDLMDSIF